MPITIWRGDFGSGKTGGMTWRLNWFKDNMNRRVLSNYGYAKRDGLIDSNILEKMPEDLKNVCLGADEIHVILDSRGTAKGKQRRITYFILQTRKRTVELHGTTQALFQIDVRLRNQIDMIIDCKSLGCPDRKKCMMKNCLGPGIANPLCGWYEYKMFDGKTGEYKGTFHLYGPRDFDNLYDTEEAILDFA